MEKKKLLLVAVSVGIFLIIVIGLSILIFLPKNRESQAGSRVISREEAAKSTNREKPDALPPEAMPFSEPSEPATVDAVGLLRNREDLGGLQPSGTGTSGQSGTPQTSNSSQLVIEIPNTSTPGIPTTTTTGSQTTPARSSSASSAVPPPPVESFSDLVIAPVSSGGSGPSQSSAASGSRSVSAVPATSGTAAAVSSRSLKANYWVQVGSFATQVRAEDAKETLASKGITAIIINRDVNGQNFFRVRIGPYTTQSEADYWIVRIKNIDGFENSQIWQNQSEL
ncbi:MAG: SPOR domain-containing protein [Spirochaetaceae bacterium]|nr:SPOR domain-containing protein [Spirochaetaceae bacterium]